MLWMPLRAHRHDAGWLLGDALMEFVHTGPRPERCETVAMVLRYDADAHKAIICAAWGPDTVRTQPGRNRGRGEVALSLT